LLETLAEGGDLTKADECNVSFLVVSSLAQGTAGSHGGEPSWEPLAVSQQLHGSFSKARKVSTDGDSTPVLQSEALQMLACFLCSLPVSRSFSKKQDLEMKFSLCHCHSSNVLAHTYSWCHSAFAG